MPEYDPWQKGFDDEPNIGVYLPNTPGVPGRRPIDSDRDDYTVYLPHSCDEWVIACGKDRAVVLAQVDRFIAALQEARGRLADA